MLQVIVDILLKKHGMIEIMIKKLIIMMQNKKNYL